MKFLFFFQITNNEIKNRVQIFLAPYNFFTIKKLQNELNSMNNFRIELKKGKFLNRFIKCQITNNKIKTGFNDFCPLITSSL